MKQVKFWFFAVNDFFHFSEYVKIFKEFSYILEYTVIEEKYKALIIKLLFQSLEKFQCVMNSCYKNKIRNIYCIFQNYGKNFRHKKSSKNWYGFWKINEFS